MTQAVLVWISFEIIHTERGHVQDEEMEEEEETEPPTVELTDEESSIIVNMIAILSSLLLG